MHTLTDPSMVTREQCLCAFQGILRSPFFIFGCLTISPSHSPGEKSSAKSCTRLQMSCTTNRRLQKRWQVGQRLLADLLHLLRLFHITTTCMKLYFVVYTSSLHAATYVPISPSSSEKGKSEMASLTSKHPKLLLYHSANHFDAHRLYSNTIKA